ncbi:MAG: helix-turn-helix domain-containing protein [Acidobacteriota bacterium]
MLVGERLWRARQARGLTQKQLAQATGIDQANISKLERGMLRDVRASNLLRLAEALGVSTDYLLGRDGTYADPPPALPALAPLLSTLEALQPLVQQAVQQARASAEAGL